MWRIFSAALMLAAVALGAYGQYAATPARLPPPAAIACNATADDGPAIDAAIARAAAPGTGGVVLLPAGTCRIDTSRGALTARSNVTLRGAGRGMTTILADGPGGTAIGHGPGDTLRNFHLRDLTFRGTRRTDLPSRADNSFAQPNAGGHLVSLTDIDNLSVVDCEFLDSRFFALLISHGRDVLVAGNRVGRSAADGIAIWSVSDVQITGNRVFEAGDDAISVHSDDTDAAPVRSGLLVTGNIVTDSLGSIAVLGMKTGRIAGNIVQRCNNGIYVGFSAPFPQGNTPLFAIDIADNLVTDIHAQTAWNPYAAGSTAWYMQVGGASRQNGAGGSPPGRPTPGTGAVPPLLGPPDTPGAFYANRQANRQAGLAVNPGAAVASPGGHWITIRGNRLLRTLPAVARRAQWGYGAQFQIGRYGMFDGAVTEAALRVNGLLLAGAMAGSSVTDNILQTTGDIGLGFDAELAQGDFADLDVARNRIADFAAFGIYFPNRAPLDETICFTDNDIDGDPYFRAPGRADHGAWRAPAPIGLYAPLVRGLTIARNRFRNTAIPLAVADPPPALCCNLLVGQPAEIGFHPANRGNGQVYPAGPQWDYAIQDSDPASPGYGTTLQPPIRAAAAQPTTGVFVQGAFVASTDPAAGILGWSRLTTGAGHAPGVDWAAIRLR